MVSSNLTHKLNRGFFISTRIVLLASSILFILLWFIYGFDSTIENIDGSLPYGFGFHISTLQMILTLSYISFINLQVGGLKSFKHLLDEVKADLRSITRFKTDYERVRSYNFKPNILSFFADLTFSALIAFASLFIFEFPYIFLLNYFQYGDLIFPVYTFQSGAVILRNFLFFVIPIIWCVLIYPRMFQFKLKYRLDRFTAIFTISIFILFMAWIVYPSQNDYKSPDEIETTIEALTWPKQDLFPQTIYPYYNVTIDNPWHVRKNIDAWHNEDIPVHFLNVFAKYMVFISVGYLFMVRFDD